jgi:hypothetical protein
LAVHRETGDDHRLAWQYGGLLVVVLVVVAGQVTHRGHRGGRDVVTWADDECRGTDGNRCRLQTESRQSLAPTTLQPLTHPLLGPPQPPGDHTVLMIMPVAVAVTMTMTVLTLVTVVVMLPMVVSLSVDVAHLLLLRASRHAA